MNVVVYGTGTLLALVDQDPCARPLVSVAASTFGA